MGRHPVRVAVYNAHWATLGGGEQLAGGVAAALARTHDVELLVDETFDPIVASERLGFDLTAVPQVQIGQGARAFLDATARYDLLVNTSFGSTFASRAPRSIYYVHFPMPNAITSPLARAMWPVASINPLAPWIEWSEGFWLREFAGNGHWTKGDATIDLTVPRGVELPFSLSLSARPWPAGRTPRARVLIDDLVEFDDEVPRRRVPLRTTVTGRGLVDPIRVRIESDSFVPRIEAGGGDDRRLGIVVSHVFLGRRLPSVRLHDVVPLTRLSAGAFTREFLDSYHVVAANSAYTARWVEELWDRPATVLAPPVRLRQRGAKRPIILAVGRFFSNVSGHSKKQLELVEAFRIACERGLRDWELHLVGGCSEAERGYVETVRKAAVGLPVRFHVNARGGDLAALFAAASIFWHAAGLGEDLQTHPDRFEHFGISVVEAMSAGAVPVVFAHGGPAAIVGETGCGELFTTTEELATRTRELVDDPDRLARLAAAACARAEDFAFDRFADGLETLVDRLVPAS
jgi:glycosyltransferase involved in cell wall biosynthesis